MKVMYICCQFDSCIWACKQSQAHLFAKLWCFRQSACMICLLYNSICYHSCNAMLLTCCTEQSLQCPMQLVDTLLQSQHSLECIGVAWSGAHPVCGFGWMCTSLVYAATGAKDSGEAPLGLCCMTHFTCHAAWCIDLPVTAVTPNRRPYDRS